MTDQLATIVRVAGEEFELADQDGDWQEFDPKAHALELKFVGSDCWVGYVCEYRVDEVLTLESVSVGWSRAYGRKHGPSLFGRRARKVEQHGVAWARFEALAHPVAFTGSLLVGQEGSFGLIPPSYRYDVVTELSFEGGRLRGRTEVTAEMQRYRQLFEQMFTGPGRAKPDEISREAWWDLGRSYSRFFASRRREAASARSEGPGE